MWRDAISDRHCSAGRRPLWRDATKNPARFGIRGCLNLLCLARVDFPPIILVQGQHCQTRRVHPTTTAFSRLYFQWKQARLSLTPSHHCHLLGTTGLSAEVLPAGNSCAAADPQGHIKHWVLVRGHNCFFTGRSPRTDTVLIHDILY